MTSREASHAGSWYTRNSHALSAELDHFLEQVPSSIKSHQVPIPRARIIIAPHAGYTYSGPTAAWAYKTLDLSKAKRIFLLGPSHTIHLPGCALSKHAKYSTPLGDLTIDSETVKELHATGKFDTISRDTDEVEHSLEMHLPYIYKMLTLGFKSSEDYPTLVPVLVGSTSETLENAYGQIFAPYLADPTSVFVVSSDFCHWGVRFQYTYYVPNNSKPGSSGISLRRRDVNPRDPEIHESIGQLDKMAMDAIEGGNHKSFLENLRETGNTICGRHPIGVVMAAISALKEEGRITPEQGNFNFVRYERSGDVVDISDSSVSYASAYAVM
ncbi:Protein MEMO1 [Lachnellula hyalina]|uniref:Protein MEMO1 n=1 Tax=Lachnellula hyalina TaxID=1316788 RepID=A0A8H8TW62_9HELO|nr:Protein MEMO1 [Lachnellula hyalina]TVY22960.1 Protein MEMO1 [Lachnellula hyalina]